MEQTYIRLFLHNGRQYEAERESYTADELGGFVPGVGDLIIDPGVLQGLDRRQPRDRRLFEVLSRYILPASSDRGARVAFVVQPRPGLPIEIDLLGE